MSNAQYLLVGIDQIELDQNNPRIKAFLEMYVEAIDDKKIIMALKQNSSRQDGVGTTLGSLRESIRTNKGIIHPVIVNHESTTGKYLVIEGNTRVMIYREMIANNVEGSWDKIPAIVHTDLEPALLDAIRLQAHLVGPRDWDPYSKGKYLDFLYRENCLTMSQIVDFCGGNRRDVIEYIEAYKLMENHYRPLCDDNDFDRLKFSAFREVQKIQINNAIVKHGFDMDSFASWVKEDKFNQLQLIRQLPRVLENAKSKEIFLKKNKTIKDALDALVSDAHTTIDIKNASFEDLAFGLIQKLRSYPYSDYRKLKDGSDSDRRNLIFELFEEVSSFCKDIETTSESDE